MPFVLFLKSSKDFASTSKYIFGGVLCIAYIVASYRTNTFSVSSECVNKIIECILSLNEFNCLNLVATFIHVFSFLEINDCSNLDFFASFVNIFVFKSLIESLLL